MTQLRLIPSSGDAPRWQTITFRGHHIRYIMIEDIPWFVLSDLAKVLGYRDAANAARLLRDSQLNTLPVSTWTELGGRGSAPTLVTEGGLNRLIMKSQSPIADDFQDWVTDEILPSIRKTGSYDTIIATDPLTALEEASQRTLQAIEMARRERARADEAEKLATRAMEEILTTQPGYRAWQKFMASGDDMDVANAAKILSNDLNIKLGRDRLFKMMGEWGWIYRYLGSGDWLIYQRQIDNGRLRARHRTYTNTDSGEEMITTPQVRIRPKGFEEIYRRLTA